MKKKIIIISAFTAVIAISLVTVLDLTNMFTKGDLTGKLYRVDNVYEEIRNMVNSEKNGTQTVLTGAFKGSEVDYDFGCFNQINIPVSDNCDVTLSFYQEQLCIWIFENGSPDSACYVYNDQTNTLYGDRQEAYLHEKFLSLYDSRVGDDAKFNAGNRGNYTYVFAEYPLSSSES